MTELPLSRALGRIAEPEYLTRKQAAAFLTKLGYAISAAHLANMAANSNAGGGPAFTRFGWKTVRYEAKDLRAWAADKRRRFE